MADLEFSTVYSKKHHQQLDAQFVLKEIKKNNPEYVQEGMYFCPDCQHAELTPYINVEQGKKLHFRTKKGAKHIEGCEHEVTHVDKKYIQKTPNDKLLKSNQVDSLLSQYSMSKEKSSNNRIQNKQGHSSSETRKNLGSDSQTGEQLTVPRKKLNQHFGKAIRNIFERYPKDSKILFLLHGNVIFEEKKSHDDYRNYFVKFKTEHGKQILLSVGCKKSKGLTNIQTIDKHLNKEVHVAMIGWLYIQEPYINFLLYNDNSIKIEDLNI